MAAKKRHRIYRKRKKRTIEAYAEKMRKNMTRSERVLWESLRRRMSRWGLEFIPQGILLNKYIGDFVCEEVKLVVEVDGSIHQLPHIKAKDRARTKMLELEGYTVIRFSNYCVLVNTYNVVKHIEKVVMTLLNVI